VFIGSALVVFSYATIGISAAARLVSGRAEADTRPQIHI
jgi:hypothetical protein